MGWQMLPLPDELLRCVYAFDPTYQRVLNLCLLQLQLLLQLLAHQA